MTMPGPTEKPPQGPQHMSIPPQPGGYAPPHIVINNTVSPSATAAASAAAGAGYWPGARKRRQSFWVHFWLFMFTAGIGNAIYAWWISRWNAERGLY